ncbi:MAG: tetratricopeptide repeat protein [Bacteroidota bacterium]|nr:tetratricopeptide repeat protein [Bacteroidota bacterium]MEC9208884.1 tetratricopeptide repeat protein [Bacteroidota bacterium]
MKNLLLILSFLISITSIAQNKKSFLRDGNKLYADSIYNKAEMQYRKSLEKDQNYFNASFNLADAIYKQERYVEASALFDALKDNAPTKNDLAKVYHNLGNSLVKEQKLEEAINAYKNALRINPIDNETRHNLVLSRKQKQEKEEQKNKDENKEQKEQDKEKKEENNKKEEKDKNQEQQEQKEEEQQKQPEEKQKEMSKEAAEKMLEAIQQQEKDLQEELQKKKIKGKRVKVLKDW